MLIRFMINFCSVVLSFMIGFSYVTIIYNECQELIEPVNMNRLVFAVSLYKFARDMGEVPEELDAAIKDFHKAEAGSGSTDSKQLALAVKAHNVLMDVILAMDNPHLRKIAEVNTVNLRKWIDAAIEYNEYAKMQGMLVSLFGFPRELRI